MTIVLLLVFFGPNGNMTSQKLHFKSEKDCVQNANTIAKDFQKVNENNAVYALCTMEFK